MTVRSELLTYANVSTGVENMKCQVKGLYVMQEA